jgi:hypothetical protein
LGAPLRDAAEKAAISSRQHFGQPMPKTHTVYDAMTFPAHEHREYPKHFRPLGADGPVFVVNDEAEELVAMMEAEASKASVGADGADAKPKEKRR